MFINIRHIDFYCILRDVNEISLVIVDFYLCNDGPVDLQILAPLTRSQCRVSINQVIVKARGPLVCMFNKAFWNIKFTTSLNGHTPVKNNN